MSDGHFRDSGGCCVLCGRCEDSACCEQVPCELRHWRAMSWWERRNALRYFPDLEAHIEAHIKTPR